MDLTEIELRITDITKAVEQSFASHQSLLGRLEEAKFLYGKFKDIVATSENIIDECEQAIEVVSE